MKRDRLPAHLYTTRRKWTAQKRGEFMAIIRAYEIFRLGCAYTPLYPDAVHLIEQTLKDGRAALSVKEWGR